MKLDLSEIVRNVGKQAVNDINEPCEPNDLEFECIGTITGKLMFTNSGELLLITGEIYSDVVMECSRCLEEFVQPFDLKLEEELRIERSGAIIKALPMDEDDDPEGELINNNILNVRELVRQNILLEIPIQPLCSEDCKGICPVCGVNKNNNNCSCNEGQMNSAFSALADLLNEYEDEK
jgi:uncharacterized protein